MNDLLKKLQNPENEYRPIPFWSWNDKLDADFMKHQIGEMKKAGLGGYFMHARSGIETEYLSEEWFDCITTGLESGEKSGLDSWIYDEAGWPSGFAGGEVTAKGDKYHARGLKLVKVSDAVTSLEKKNLLGVYRFNPAANEISPADVENERTTGELFAVYHTACPYYIDILNPMVTKEFIACTHERYYERYPEKFGKSLKGFFTDEPRISEGEVPWSYIIPEEFQKRNGYDITEYLPLLFINAEGFEKVRFDFWSLVSDLFVNGYMKQIYDWCTAHNCQLTGHMMMEETLYSQMTGTSGSMPFYEFMHMPGVDWLRRTMENPVVSKQVGSVAEQLGKKHVITESYALTGWDVRFEELKWIAEWQFVNGVNVMCQHLQGYTLRGMRKRDYPPSLFFQQTWWDEYSAFNDYLARLGTILTDGTKQVEVLLLHPMQSGWIAYDGSNNADIKKLDSDFADTAEALSGIHCDYHLGDETIIKRYGKIENKKITVKNGVYSVVVMPSMKTISSSTLKLLEEFIAVGGTVISYGEFPMLCDGVKSERLTSLQKKVVTAAQKEQLLTSIKPLLETQLSILAHGKEVGSIHYCERNSDDGKILFLVNHSKTDSYNTSITISGGWNVTKISLDTLETGIISSQHGDSKTIFDLYFDPMQSYVLHLSERKEPKTESIEPSARSIFVPLKDKLWDIEKMDLNCLTLDTCTYRVDGGELQPKTAVIHLMQKLLELKHSCHIEMNFDFEISADLEDIHECFAAIEQLKKFKVCVNGHEVEYKDIGWWKDSSFEKAAIRPFLHKGMNTISLSGDYFQSQKVYDVIFGENVYETELNKLTYDTELESIYLVGDFGVISKSDYKVRERNGITTGHSFEMVNRPLTLNSGDFTKQGLCFFAGKLTICTDITVQLKKSEEIFLDLGTPRCAMLKLSVNGILVKTVLWAPYKIDVTEYLLDGDNHISIELFSSNRNLMGPHHHIDGEIYNVGPESFTGKWSWCDRPTEGVESNPDDMQKNYWTDNYTFVTFGL